MTDRPELVAKLGQLGDDDLLAVLNETLRSRGQGSTTTEAAPPQGAKGSVARGRAMYEAQRRGRSNDT